MAAKQPTTKKAKTTTKKAKLINHFAAVLDATLSISGLKQHVVDKFNVQLKSWQEGALESGQETTLTLVIMGTAPLQTMAGVTPRGFRGSGDHSRVLYTKVPIAQVKPLTMAEYWIAAGGTALLDATALGADAIFDAKADKNTSYLIVTITDGGENASTRFHRGKGFAEFMKELTKTDVWTFTFLVPRGEKVSFCNEYGVPEGNVEVWETGSVKGIAHASAMTQSGSQAYFAARGAGARSTKSFFSPDLSGLKLKKVQRELDDVSGNFKRMQVTAEAGIRVFFEQATGDMYEIGRGFYQLTKPEDVQDYKQVVVEDKATRKLYSGAEARDLIGMPTTGTTRVKPLDLGKYNIFIQSTSVNRKLVRGTTMLYLKQNVPIAV